MNHDWNLTLVSSMPYREHNRIARELKRINTLWDDERLFMEARRILNAEYQGQI